jgi:hypothetical protein
VGFHELVLAIALLEVTGGIFVIGVLAMITTAIFIIEIKSTTLIGVYLKDLQDDP